MQAIVNAGLILSATVICAEAWRQARARILSSDRRFWLALSRPLVLAAMALDYVIFGLGVPSITPLDWYLKSEVLFLVGLCPLCAGFRAGVSRLHGALCLFVAITSSGAIALSLIGS